jgi:hypothetical protein
LRSQGNAPRGGLRVRPSSMHGAADSRAPLPTPTQLSNRARLPAAVDRFSGGSANSVVASTARSRNVKLDGWCGPRGATFSPASILSPSPAGIAYSLASPPCGIIAFTVRSRNVKPAGWCGAPSPANIAASAEPLPAGIAPPSPAGIAQSAEPSPADIISPSPAGIAPSPADIAPSPASIAPSPAGINPPSPAGINPPSPAGIKTSSAFRPVYTRAAPSPPGIISPKPSPAGILSPDKTSSAFRPVYTRAEKPPCEHGVQTSFRTPRTTKARNNRAISRRPSPLAAPCSGKRSNPSEVKARALEPRSNCSNRRRVSAPPSRRTARTAAAAAGRRFGVGAGSPASQLSQQEALRGDTAGRGGDTGGRGGDTAGRGGDTAGRGGDTAGRGGDTLRRGWPSACNR